MVTEETPAVGHVSSYLAPSEAFGLETDADEVTGDDAHIAAPEPFQSGASGETPNEESGQPDELAPRDIFAELDAALVRSEPAGSVGVDDFSDDEGRRDDTG